MSENINNQNPEEQRPEELSLSELGEVSAGATPILMQYCASGKHIEDDDTADDLLSTQESR